MTTPDAQPDLNALGKKTFNVLRGWDKTWSWGDRALLDQAGGYGEAFTAFAGPSKAIDALEAQVLQIATESAGHIVAQGKELPSFGVGRWVSNGHSLLCIQSIYGSSPLCPVASLDPQLVSQVKMLGAPEMVMDGPSDTIWDVVRLATHAPTQSEANDWFALAARQFTTEDLERLRGTGPLIGALCAWVDAKHLAQALPEGSQGSHGSRL